MLAWIISAIQIVLAIISIAVFSGAARRARRDYIATQAMQAFIAGHVMHHGHEEHWPYPALASEAYDMADAMLAASASTPREGA